MNATVERYQVQCISGDSSHVMQVVRGSELEAKCFQRAESGKLDALILSTDECPMCGLESQNQRARNFELYLGCPMADLGGDCAADCPCKTELTVSPWHNQVEGFALSS